MENIRIHASGDAARLHVKLEALMAYNEALEHALVYGKQLMDRSAAGKEHGAVRDEFRKRLESVHAMRAAVMRVLMDREEFDGKKDE